MDDILTWLRTRAEWEFIDGSQGIAKRLREAAAEIERLQEFERIIKRRLGQDNVDQLIAERYTYFRFDMVDGLHRSAKPAL